MAEINRNISSLVWLEEYKTSSSDIGIRVSLQHGLLNIELLFVSGVSAYLFKTYLDSPNSLFDIAHKLILLFVPIIVAFFAIRHLNHDVNIIDKAKYIDRVIRPHIIEITGDKDNLGFEEFIDEARRSRAKKYGFLIWLGGEHIFHVIFFSLFFGAGLYIFFFAPGTFVFASNWKEGFLFGFLDALLIVDVFLFYQVIRLLFRVGIGYGGITSDLKNKGAIKKKIKEFISRKRKHSRD
jgi:hypothetical protein